MAEPRKLPVAAVVNDSHRAPVASKEQQVGIEIEVEHYHTTDDVLSPPIALMWNVTSDGSLRNNGAEFVSVPIPRSIVGAALGMFYDLMQKHHYRTHMRCGIHVHVNCLDKYMDDLGGIFAAYSIVEPALYRYCGAIRDENIYCVPWYRSPSEADLVASIINGHKPLNRLHTRSQCNTLCKYSGLNAGPLSRFGTIEFRHAPTWTDQAVARRWVEIVCDTVAFGASASPDTVIEAWHNDPQAFLRAIFTEDFLHSKNMVDVIESTEAVSNAEKFLASRQLRWDVDYPQVEGDRANGYAMWGGSESNEARTGRRTNTPTPVPESDVPAPRFRTLEQRIEQMTRAAQTVRSPFTRVGTTRRRP